jgi:hypothetical protein
MAVVFTQKLKLRAELERFEFLEDGGACVGVSVSELRGGREGVYPQYPLWQPD